MPSNSHDGDGGHGYTQGNRWGDGTWETITLSNGSTVQVANGDRDCGSGIISALEAVGVDCHGASYTGNMRECLLATGLFKWAPIDQRPHALSLAAPLDGGEGVVEGQACREGRSQRHRLEPHAHQLGQSGG